MYGPYVAQHLAAAQANPEPRLTSQQVVAVPPVHAVDLSQRTFVCRSGHITVWMVAYQMTWCDTCGWGGDEVPAVGYL